MKKLLLLGLLLMGMVSTAMATNHTVYFKPGSNWTAAGARFALYMFKDGDGAKNTWVNFAALDGHDGYYTATYDDSYSTGMIIVRFSGSDAENNWDKKWGQTSNLPAPSADILYEVSDFNNTGYSSSINTTWVMAGNRHISGNYDNWDGSSANNILTAGTDFSYSKTVEGLVIKAGTYGYKFVGGGSWVGDPNNSGNNFTLTIAEDGVYNIAYTFNDLTHAATAVATKTEDATVEYKYYVYDDYYYTKDDHRELSGNVWGDNVMTEKDGKFYFTLNNKALEATDYGFRIIEQLYKNGALYRDDNWNWNYIDKGDNNRGYRITTIGSAGNYDVTICFDPISSNYDNTDSNPSISVNKGYYIVKQGTPSWTVGDRMTSSCGVWSSTISDWAGKCFAIIAADNTSGFPASWDGVIHPSGGSDYVVNFEAYSGSTGGSKTWKAADGNDGKITINYTPSSNTWSIDCAREATIGTAGYITYSNGEKCIVSGAEAIYVVSENKTNSVHLEEKAAATVWPASEGMILKGTNGDIITINAVAWDATASTIGTNYLVGTGNSETEVAVPNPNTTIYVFSWDGSDPSTVGFYKASATGNLGAHKAYLDLSRSSFNAREDFLGFNFGEDETDGIDAAKVNVISGTAYNLAGQKVGANYKGIVIVNGKKVVRK